MLEIRRSNASLVVIVRVDVVSEKVEDPCLNILSERPLAWSLGHRKSAALGAGRILWRRQMPSGKGARAAESSCLSQRCHQPPTSRRLQRNRRRSPRFLLFPPQTPPILVHYEKLIGPGTVPLGARSSVPQMGFVRKPESREASSNGLWRGFALAIASFAAMPKWQSQCRPRQLSIGAIRVREVRIILLHKHLRPASPRRKNRGTAFASRSYSCRGCQNPRYIEKGTH
jgi:hypothetical protein